MKKLISVAGLMLLVGVFASCGNQPEQEQPVMFVSYHGGLCVTGGECEETFVVYSDGSYSGDRTGHLSEEETSRLKKLVVSSDLSSLSQHLDPTPDCPSYADGMDMTVRFPKEEAEQFTTCLFEGSELLSFVESLSF